MLLQKYNFTLLSHRFIDPYIRFKKIIENDLAKEIIAKGIHITEKYRALYLRNKELNYCNMTTALFLSVKKLRIINFIKCKIIFPVENLRNISFVQYMIYKVGYIFFKWTTYDQFTLLSNLNNEVLLYDDWINIIKLNKAPPNVLLNL